MRIWFDDRSLPVSHFGGYVVGPDRETPLENDDIGVQLLQVRSKFCPELIIRVKSTPFGFNFG